jgi:acetylornithine deacetylase/succinyl-diaminopimelate desuccinylase-like protein
MNKKKLKTNTRKLKTFSYLCKNIPFMKDVKNYIETNQDRFLQELFGLIRIPSISSGGKKEDMEACAQYLKKSLLEAGADKAEVMPTKGNPVVYAEKIIDPKLKTVLVYGHYDVMPADPIDLWTTPPFEPAIRDGKIYARGANDDKGQLFMHAKAFEFMVKTDQLPCNVKFMLEGEEEIGSPSLEAWCVEHINMLNADVILVSDTSMIAKNIPSITTGLRGISKIEIEVTGPSRDLHSGLFGGAVANPANILAKMIADLFDENNRIAVPGFYDDVIEVSAEERTAMAQAPFSQADYNKALDIDQEWGEKGYSTNERTGIRPALDVNGIWSGYTGEGSKTIVPSVAKAKISIRLVPAQDNNKIAELIKKHLENTAPKYVKVKVTQMPGGQAYVSPIDMPAYKAAEKAYQTVYGKMPIPTRSGGSIPIISTFEKVLGLKSILMGFGLESDAIHSPNESFELERFFKGIETIPHFYQAFAAE